MAGYGRKGYKRARSRKIVKKRTSGTSSRRKLQGLMNKQTRRAVNLVTGAVPVARAAYNLYQFAKSARKPGSRNRTKVQKDTQGGGYNQWSQQYDQKTFGKLTSRKIQKMSLDKITLLHQRIGAFNDNGQVWVSNYDDNAGTKYYPLFLFELNSAPNYINGIFNGCAPVYQLTQLSPASGNRMSLNAQSGQNQDGSLGGVGWQVEKSSHTDATSMTYPLENAIHAWSSLDLELWGATAKPTKYNICLCQFNEDVMFPDLIVSNNWYYDSQPTSANNASEFWQSLVKQYSYSPLAKLDDGFSTKKMKILRSYTVNIDPTANYENDPDPHVKTMKLFYRFNRQCNFQWKFANAAPLSKTDMNEPDWKQEDGQNQTRVHPNARMFIMVRASNYTPITAPTAITSSTTPSISWRLRSCFLINQ